jgi:hypothetical protein
MKRKHTNGFGVDRIFVCAGYAEIFKKCIYRKSNCSKKCRWNIINKEDSNGSKN